ncbi:MAG: hypothetical protein LBD58_11220 [Treponema sp.]|nr:hypothetical protein [Treponema sp.]
MDKAAVQSLQANTRADAERPDGGQRLGIRGSLHKNSLTKSLIKSRLFQNFSSGTATLDVIEKPGPKW